MTATSVCVPRGSSSCPLPLWETLKDHKFRKYYIGIVYFWDCLRFKFGAVLSSTVIPPCPALSCSGDPQPSTLSWTRDLGPPEADDPPFDSSPHFLSSHHEGTASSQVGCPQWRLYPSLTWGCLCTHTFLLPGVHPAVYPVAGWKFERGQSNLVTPDVSWNLNQAIPRVVLTNSYSFMPCYILLHLICRMKKIPEGVPEGGEKIIYQFKASRYNFGSTYMTTRVTSTQKPLIDTQKQTKKGTQAYYRKSSNQTGENKAQNEDTKERKITKTTRKQMAISTYLLIILSVNGLNAPIKR
ncbi:uncharacterized protein LOC106730858 [Camelus ferus]|uniref:Uncharacterized protein LOC106730858 n=1 Tax=Camelus ferus TaxID=419612 RepID=A0A8B8T987_CAMFR|nr:uncharacterized protein LOC106730858 [Camelus ferus]